MVNKVSGVIMMTDTAAFLLLLICLFLYKLVKTENVREAMTYSLLLIAGAVLLIWFKIADLLFVLGLVCLIFSGDGKRPGYPYSARAGQLRAWHAIHQFKRRYK